MINFDEKLDREKRTEEEIKMAHLELAYAFNPKRVYQYDTWMENFKPIPCEKCGETEYHAITCPCVNYYSECWTTNVSNYKYPGGKCKKPDCSKKATMRIRINVWGSLYECDVCEEHGMFDDGKSKDLIWCDDL